MSGVIRALVPMCFPLALACGGGAKETMLGSTSKSCLAIATADCAPNDGPATRIDIAGDSCPPSASDIEFNLYYSPFKVEWFVGLGSAQQWGMGRWCENVADCAGVKGSRIIAPGLRDKGAFTVEWHLEAADGTVIKGQMEGRWRTPIEGAEPLVCG